MGIDLNNGFKDLRHHLGHDVRVVTYGPRRNPDNVAIECYDCSEILLDFDAPHMIQEKASWGDIPPDAVFVFGSNLAGAHLGGAAKAAFCEYGAAWGEAEGLHGRSYALPTCDKQLRPLPLVRVGEYVARFLGFATRHKDRYFQVTKIGCGIAGFSEEQIAPLFRDAPINCLLPHGWRVTPAKTEQKV